MNDNRQNYNVLKVAAFHKNKCNTVTWKKEAWKCWFPSNYLWDIGSFLVEFISGTLFFFHMEVTVFTTDLAAAQLLKMLRSLLW